MGAFSTAVVIIVIIIIIIIIIIIVIIIIIIIFAPLREFPDDNLWILENHALN